MKRQSVQMRRNRRWIIGTSLVAGLMLLGSSVLSMGGSASAAKSPFGIVPLGATNEGFPNGTNSATGILVLSGGPCIGPVITHQKEERLATRITLYRGAKEIAQWEIYGEQKIAWVEPVGAYSVSASDYMNDGKVHFMVDTSRNAVINLNPGCL
jgi:hypothetical protein